MKLILLMLIIQKGLIIKKNKIELRSRHQIWHEMIDGFIEYTGKII